MTNTIHDDLMEIVSKAPPEKLTGTPKMKRDMKRIRSTVLEGLSDRVLVPQILTEQAQAAHNLLGCPLFNGMLLTIKWSYDLPPEPRHAVQKVIVEAITGMAYRLITEGRNCLRKEYGGCEHDN